MALYFNTGTPDNAVGALNDYTMDLTNEADQKIAVSKKGASVWAAYSSPRDCQIIRIAGAPNDAVGRDGDIAVNVAAGTYFLKAAGAWGTAAAELPDAP